RTDGFGERRRSSTSGVLPTSSSREEAVAELRTALPDVDGAAELAEHEVDAPQEAVRGDVHRDFSEALHELGAPAVEACDREQRGRSVPVTILDHSLSPL